MYFIFYKKLLSDAAAAGVRPPWDELGVLPASAWGCKLLDIAVIWSGGTNSIGRVEIIIGGGTYPERLNFFSI